MNYEQQEVACQSGVAVGRSFGSKESIIGRATIAPETVPELLAVMGALFDMTSDIDQKLSALGLGLDRLGAQHFPYPGANTGSDFADTHVGRMQQLAARVCAIKIELEQSVQRLQSVI